MVTILTMFLLLLVVTLPFSSQALRSLVPNNVPSNIFNVFDYGAIGNGDADDTQAFRNAWDSTCKCSGSPTMLIPKGHTFLLRPLIFHGSCTSKAIRVEINGNIVGESEISKWKYNSDGWIVFDGVDGLSITGFGTINGHGSIWWDRHVDENTDHPLQKRVPSALRIQYCNNVNIGDLHILDSPKMHVVIEGCSWVDVHNLTIQAPGDSPKTDGIHISGSQHVNVYHCTIGTGDDCISIVSGSSNINATDITCGPGHGISIGSLGQDGEIGRVEGVTVKHVTLTGTTNGVRIKTWQGGNGYARNVIFEQIFINSVDRPIIIDQYYCDEDKPCQNQTAAVQVSNITYEGVFGTTNKEVAVEFSCSETVACTDISVKNINITSVTNHGLKPSSYCLNAKGIAEGYVVPVVPCLQHT